MLWCCYILLIIREQRTSKKSLSLTLVPGDPACTPMFGVSKSTSGLLLKVRRPKEPSKAFISEIVGLVDRTIHFRGVADYQIDIIEHKSASDTLGDVNEALPEIFEQFETNEASPITYSELDLAVPSICYSKNPPSDYNFRNKATNRYSFENNQMKLQRRKVNKNLFEVIRIYYSEEIPSYPSPQFANLSKPKKLGEILTSFPSNFLPEHKKILEKLESLFEDPKDNLHAYSCRPIWHPATILQFFPESQKNMVAALLPGVAFFFKNGAWKGLAVRYGYDPARDPKSRL